MRRRTALLFLLVSTSRAFEFPNPFGARKVSSGIVSSTKVLEQQLLQQIQGTANGKTATPDQQQAVLTTVAQMEASFKPPENLLSDQDTALRLLDGPWYLQYTSPSQVGDADQFPDAWKPQYQDQENVETRQFQAQGSVSAAGITVDTSQRVVVQNLDVTASRVSNQIQLDWGEVYVAGSFRPSSLVPNRAVVAFDTAVLTLQNGFEVRLDFAFAALALLRGGNRDNGWLETTYCSDQMRVGRGNKGTLFVLTKEPLVL